MRVVDHALNTGGSVTLTVEIAGKCQELTVRGESPAETIRLLDALRLAFPDDYHLPWS